MTKPAKKTFEAEMEVEKYNEKGDKIQLTPELVLLLFLLILQ